jgi:glycosyltransferase involved in cell wall biosynthesis
MISHEPVCDQSISVIQYESYRHWIIDGMMKDSLNALNISANWYFLPDSKKSLIGRASVKLRIWRNTRSTQVFGNHKTYFDCLPPRMFPPKKIRIFLTQVLDDDLSLKRASSDSLARVERFVVQNHKIRDYLISIGVGKDRVVVNPGGINRNHFYPIQDKDLIGDFILISGSFKYRKNPELIADVIRSFPNIKFIIHGHNLEVFPKDIGDNVELLAFDFQNQATLIRSARLHLILSKIEGGPMSVLEALASGTPCVTTDVGFCREVINASSGVVLNENPTISEIGHAINIAWELKETVFMKDLLDGNFTWEQFGEDLFL